MAFFSQHNIRTFAILAFIIKVNLLGVVFAESSPMESTQRENITTEEVEEAEENYTDEDIGALLEILGPLRENLWQDLVLQSEPDFEFCQKWNPAKIDLKYFEKHGCCSAPVSYLKTKKKRGRKYFYKKNTRVPASQYRTACDAITDEQKKYIDAVRKSELPEGQKINDVLEYLLLEVALQREQAYCSVNHGFLANGRALVETEMNRLQILRPEKCTYFGTDSLVAVLEWLGRSIGEEFSDRKIKLRVGDLSAPRGGAIVSSRGYKSHSSHTNGQDVDLGFLAELNDGNSFGKAFDFELNWWLLKKIFKNPIACVQVVFLDRSIIAQLKKKYSNEPEWELFSGYLKHARGHKNHFHIRIGTGLPVAKGEKGRSFRCQSGPSIENELNELNDENDLEDSESLDFFESGVQVFDLMEKK